MKQQDNDVYKQLQCQQTEKKLKTIISDFSIQKKLAEDAQQKYQDAVIFVGDTGAGKSTLVNWLNQAEFEAKDIDGILSLEMKQDQKQKFSPTGDGTQSITQYPIYFENESQSILTIDFPGFRDTRGWTEQLIVKMMYMDIVNRFKTKFVIVIDRPTQNFHTRGQSLQDLVHTTFQPQDEASIESICLILNKFTKSEEKFIQQSRARAKIQLEDMRRNHEKEPYSNQIYKALQQNIQVVCEIDSTEKYLKFFSEEQRLNLWEQIKKTQPLKIDLKTIEKSETIAEYLEYKGNQYIQEIQKILAQCFSNEALAQKTTQSLESIQNVLKQYIQQLEKSFNLKSYKETTMFLKQFIQSCNTSEIELQSIENKYAPYFEIFEFFEFYGKYIKCYQGIDTKISGVIQYVSQIQARLQTQIESQKKQAEQQQQLASLQTENKELKDSQISLYKDAYNDSKSQVSQLQNSFQNTISNTNSQLTDVIKKISENPKQDQQTVTKNTDEKIINLELQQVQQMQKQKEVETTIKEALKVIITKEYEFKDNEMTKKTNISNDDKTIIDSIMQDIENQRNLFKNANLQSLETMKQILLNECEQREQKKNNEDKIARKKEKDRQEEVIAKCIASLTSLFNKLDNYWNIYCKYYYREQREQTEYLECQVKLESLLKDDNDILDQNTKNTYKTIYKDLVSKIIQRSKAKS